MKLSFRYSSKKKKISVYPWDTVDTVNDDSGILKLNQRIYRLQNLGTNNEGGDFVVSFDARVLKNTTINVNFCDIGAEENNGDIALTTAFQHYVLHFKNIQSVYHNP